MANVFAQFVDDAPQENVFAQFVDESKDTPTTEQDVGRSTKGIVDEGDIHRGFDNTFRQLPQIGYGLTAIAGATGEKVFGEGGISTGIKKAGLEGYQEASANMEQHSKPSDSLTYSWDRAKEGHFGDLADWVQHGIGYAGGQGLQMLATAGFGNVVAKEGVKAFATELTAKMVASEAAKIGAADAVKVAANTGITAMTAEAIQQAAVKGVASKIGGIGANTAMGGMALGMEGGEIGGDLVTKAQERGTPLTGTELAQGFGATLGAGALEFVGDKFGLDILTGKSKLYKALGSAPGLGGRVGRGVAAGAIAGIPEAATEYGQTLTEEYGKGNDPFSAEAKQQAFDAAGQGAIGGHVMGLAGGLLTPPQPKTPEEIAAELLARQQALADTASTGPLGNALATGGIANTDVAPDTTSIDGSLLDTRTPEQTAQDEQALVATNQNESTALSPELNTLVADEQPQGLQSTPNPADAIPSTLMEDSHGSQESTDENTQQQTEIPESGDVANPPSLQPVAESNAENTQTLSQPLSSEAATPHEIAAKNTQAQLPAKIYDSSPKVLGGLSVRGFVADKVNENTQFSEDNGKFYLGDTTGAGKQQVTKAVHTYGQAYQTHLNTAIEDDSNTDANILVRAKEAINSEHITPFQKESLDDGINHIENGGNVSGGFAILRRDLPPTEEFISNETTAANDTEQNSPVPVDNNAVTRGNEITPTVGETRSDVLDQEEVVPRYETATLLNKKTKRPFKTRTEANIALADPKYPEATKDQYKVEALPNNEGFVITPKEPLIFGHTFEEIEAAQQKGTLSKPVVHTDKPLATDKDISLFNEIGLDGLKNKQFHGVIDRLQNSGIINEPTTQATNEPRTFTHSLSDGTLATQEADGSYTDADGDNIDDDYAQPLAAKRPAGRSDRQHERATTGVSASSVGDAMAEHNAAIVKQPSSTQATETVDKLPETGALATNDQAKIPQVAQPTLMQRNVELNTVNGTTVKGDRYLFPNNERHPIIITKPYGNKGAATKQNHIAWDEVTGSAIYSEPAKAKGEKPSAQHVIDVVSGQFNAGLGNKLDGHESRNKEQQSPEVTQATAAVQSSGEKVDTYHPAIHSLAADLTVGGGSGYTYDRHGTITGRTSSTNPEWFINGAFITLDDEGNQTKDKPSVKDIQTAVDDHYAGKRLTPKQKRILSTLSDTAHGLEQAGNNSHPENYDFEQTLLDNDLQSLLDNNVISIDDIQHALDEYDDSIPFDVEGDNLSIQQLEDWLGITNEERKGEKSATGDTQEELTGYTAAELATREREQAQRDKQAAADELKAKQKEAADKSIDSFADEMLGNTGNTDLFGGNPLADLGKADEITQDKTDETTSNYGKTNKVFTESAADKARALLKSKLGQLNSGLDPELVQAGITLAGYHIEAGARDFSSYTKAMIDDLGEAIRPYLRSFYESVRHYPSFNNQGMTSSTNIDNGVKEHAPSTNADLESDSKNTGTKDLDVSGTVQSGRKSSDKSTGQTSNKAESTRNDSGLDSSDPINPTALNREPSDQQIHTTEQPALSSELPAGVTDSDRSGNTGNAGIQADNKPINKIKELAKQRVTTPATTGKVILADATSIADTLPILKKGQQADVLFAEKRLEEHKGVLFTNGTGTGKTFTALGIIKRFALQGKKSAIIVVPSVNIAQQWIYAATKFFDLTISPLENTRDNGKGIVISTYANFGMNESLPLREWDLVVADESHKLLQNEDGVKTDALDTLRGITYHRNGFYPWFNATYSKVVGDLHAAKIDYEATRANDVRDDVKRLADKNYETKQATYNKTIEKAKLDYEVLRKEKDPKVVLLSATPFAYAKTVDYAEGLLFHYGTGRDGGGYNSGNDQDHFFMNHFGYRMRYNKLTKPDAKVDTGLMERQFNSTLRKTGALSFRALDVDFDYDRKFILIDSVMGRRIDEALDWIREQKYDLLSDLLKDKFDYLQRRYMLEALKAREAVKIVAEHLAIGRKVLVFHDYKKGGVRNPFIFSMTIDKELNDQISDFNTKFSDIINEFDSLPSPIDLFRHAFRDDVMIYNGSIPSKERIKLVQSFNDDNSGKNLILVQSASAKEGVSFHDTTGKHPRVLFNLGLPTQPTTAIQQEGRIYRVGQESDAMFRYLNTGTSWERWAFATTIAQRASTAENLAAGEGARALKQSFIDGFQDSDTYPAGFEGEGKGGKEIDKAAASAITEFDRAKTYYFGQGKKTSRNKSAEGKDYFATPEPVGWFMTQLADARTGDSMLEPSAGHGAIARFFRDDAKTTAIEPSGELSSRLAMVFDGDVKRMDFEDLDIHNKYHTIVMNPPFGVGGKVAIEHLDKATKHLPMNGRVVALIPEGGTADKRFDKWLYGDDKGAKGVEGLYLAANISLPTCTFERAGTQVKTRIVVIDRVSNDDAKNIHAKNIDLSSIEDINKLFDRIEDLTVQPRNVTEQKEEAPKPTANASANTAGDKYITSEPETTYTTKKGKVLHGVIAKDIDLAEAQKFDKYAWKRDGGIFIRMDNVARPDGGTALFSKASILSDNAKPKGITKDQADAAIGEFIRDFDGIDGVTFNHYETLADAIGESEAKKIGRVKGFYLPIDKTITIIRDSLGDVQDTITTLRHETLGHFGLNLLTPADKLAFLASISHDKNTNALRPFFDDVVRDYPEMGQDEFMQAEEVFAKIAEEQPTALTEWLDRKLLKLSPLLRKIGFLKGHVTKAEMRKMVKSLAEGIRRGARQQTFPKNNQSQFSHSTPTNTPSDNESLTDKFNNTFSQKNKDTAIYQFQDKYIDLKRKMQSVVKNGGAITEIQDARTAEELYHKRLSQRNEDFLKDELNPILKGLHSAGITMAHFQTFLHAQHAPSRNKVMAQRNPNQTMIDEAITDITDQLEQLDHQSAPLTTAQKAEHKDLEKELKRWTRATPFQGTEEDRLALSGMSNTEASAFINGLSAQDKQAMTPLAKLVYAINNKTLDLQVSYGLEQQDTIDGLRSAWDNYVPLHRDEAHPDSYSHPIGSGFSVKGSAFKNALGSNSEVTNILTHIAMAREQALVRGEKLRVEIHLANLLTAHPDPDFATVGKVPTVDTLVNGFKETNIDPSYRNKHNYVMMRLKGKDIGIEFNERNESAVRLALALKNLDGVDLDKFESFFAKGTRWISAVNTQYNLVFGIMNLMRDVSGGAINLSSTPLAGKQAQVMKAVFPALQAIYGIERGLENHELSALYKEYGLAGATTGFRDLFADVNDRKKAIIREFERHDDGMPRKTLMAIGQWLSDFNTAMENAVRLATYKVARESGLSIDKSASIAKNITVNFNRKGAATTKIGAFYAFFNASMQGSARMIETLSGPSGKKIIASGVALGAISTLIGMAAMGDDDWDKIPEHIRERNLIIPNLASKGDYFAIPLPLGFNILPNIGRKTVEAAFGSNRISKTQRFGELLGSIIGTFNPLGGGDVIQALTPTVADPVVALIGNKDWTGKTIYKEDFNALNPTPGFTRAKSTATTPSKLLAEGLNKITGGTDYKQGAWSPTPDQIDYIFAQLTGGTGRELMHIEELAASLSNDQEVPMYKIPLLGKLYGETSGNSVERGLYYENVKRINAHHEEIDGLRAETNGGSKVNDYLNENPEAGLIGSAEFINKSIDRLNKSKKLQLKNNANAAFIRTIDDKIAKKMKLLNDKMLEVN